LNDDSRMNFISKFREVLCIQLARIIQCWGFKNVMRFLFDKNKFIGSANKHENLNVDPVAQSTLIER